MAFIKGTNIFTNSGWKPIETISGNDNVLVRNFLGDAEFIQPFALKKRQYNGEIYEIGGRNWSFSVTPDHIVVYDRDDKVRGRNFVYEKAKDLEINADNRIYRKFKYITPEDYKKENIVIYDDFGKRWVTISNLDWFVLCGYVLLRGYLEPAGRRRALNIYLDRQKREDELVVLADILDRIGVVWNLIESRTDDRWILRVNPHNTLSSKLAARLGSLKRKKMFIPDKMIYNSSKELASTLIETIINVSKRPETSSDSYQFTSNNVKLIDSLEMLCTLWGYSVSRKISAHKGQDVGRGKLKKDVYNLVITSLPQSYSPTHINKKQYNDYVYELNLFDGQVYVKDGTAPVWIDPK